MSVEYTTILKQIEKNNFSPIYFLQGEETFFIDTIVKAIEENALDPTQRSFNQTIVYGKDVSLLDVLGAAKRYPMMGDRQVVIVKEAQENKEWNREQVQSLLLNYLENPLASTILVFAYKYKTLDKRTKLGKAFEKNAILLTAKKLYDNQVPDWIRSYAISKGVKIEENAIMMLSENIGNNLQRLVNELEKVVINIDRSTAITAQMIQRYVGISKDYNIFELQKSLSTMNKAKALKIAQYFAANPGNNPLVLTIYSLFGYFSKLLMIHNSKDKSERAVASLIGVNPFFVKEYLVAARNYPVQKVIGNLKHLQTADLQSKGIGAATKKEHALLTELMYKLMN
ncbi:MAG: DNA polymerase III subunit delta [Bacteroidota bacterium]